MASSQSTSPAPSASRQADPVVIAKFKRQMRWLWIHYGVWMGIGFFVYGPPRLLPEAYLNWVLGACFASSALCTVLFYKCPACTRSLVGTAVPLACSHCGTALMDVKR
jgi:hypothetical protein